MNVYSEHSRKSGLIHPSEKDKVNSFSDHRSQLISNLHFIFHTFLLQYLPSHAHIQYSLAIFFLHMHYFEIVKNINCTFSREVSLPFIQESQSSSAVTIFPSVTVFKANYSSKFHCKSGSLYPIYWRLHISRDIL